MEHSDRLYALEYQESGGNFYYNGNDGVHQPNTAGYKTISVCTFDDCSDFCNNVRIKYDFGIRPYPTFETILEEWNMWKKSIIQQRI